MAQDNMYYAVEEQKTTDPLDEEYSSQDDNQDDMKPSTGVIHNEEGPKRMNLDKDDCDMFLAEMQKHSYPLHWNWKDK